MRDVYRRYIGRDVVVQVGEDSLAGKLISVNGGALRLSDAVLLGANPVDLDGDVVIPIGRARWVQVP